MRCRKLTLAPLLLFGFLASLPVTADGHGEGRVWSAYDTNGDGFLDRKEFEALRSRRHLEGAVAELWRFERIDSDGNGLVSRNEQMDGLREEMRLRREQRTRRSRP